MKNRPHTDISKKFQGALFEKISVSVPSIEELVYRATIHAINDKVGKQVKQFVWMGETGNMVRESSR